MSGEQVRVVFTPSGLEIKVDTARPSWTQPARSGSTSIRSVGAGASVAGARSPLRTGSFDKWASTGGAAAALTPVGPTEANYHGKRPLTAGPSSGVPGRGVHRRDHRRAPRIADQQTGGAQGTPSRRSHPRPDRAPALSRGTQGDARDDDATATDLVTRCAGNPVGSPRSRSSNPRSARVHPRRHRRRRSRRDRGGVHRDGPPGPSLRSGTGSS